MEDKKKIPKMIKVYMKKHQVDQLDKIALKKKTNRSKLVKCVVEDFLGKESNAKNVLG